MPRYNYMQNSFISGQISPKLVARTDVNEYKTGLKELTNMGIYRSGGVYRRNGFTLAGNDYTPSYGEYVRIPFTRLDGSTANIIIKLGTGAEIYEEGDPTFIRNFLGTNVTANVQGVNASYKLNWVQHNRDLIIVHADGELEPIIISETFPSNFIGGSKFTFQNWTDNISLLANPTSPVNTIRAFGVPVGIPNNTDTTLNTNTTPTLGGSTILVASAAIFDVGHINSYFYLDQEDRHFIVEVTGYLTATTLTVEVVAVSDTAPTSATTDYWYEANWSDYRGWPRTIQAHNGALVFGGNKTQPTTLWSSEVGSLFEFNFYFDNTQGTKYSYQRTPTVSAASPFERTLGNSQGDSISWMKSGKSLLVGTTSTEYAVDISGGNALPQTYEGGAAVQVATADNFTYYVSRDRKSIHEIGYSNDNGSFISRNITTLSDEIIGTSRIRKLTWYSPTNTLYFLTDDKKLYSVNLHRSAQVTGFSSVVISDDPNLKVEDMYVGKDGDGNDFFNVVIQQPSRVNYTAPSGVGLSIITLGDKEFFDVYLDLSEATFDLVTPGEWNTRFVGTTVVTVLVPSTGVVYENVSTDASGSIIGLPGGETNEDIVYGENYTSRIKTLNLEVGPNPLLNSQGNINRVDRVTLKAYKTKAGSYGSEGTDLYDFEIDNNTEFTGNIQVDLPQSPDDENFVIIETNEPKPMSILGMVMRGVNNGG